MNAFAVKELAPPIHATANAAILAADENASFLVDRGIEEVEQVTARPARRRFLRAESGR